MLLRFESSKCILVFLLLVGFHETDLAQNFSIVRTKLERGTTSAYLVIELLLDAAVNCTKVLMSQSHFGVIMIDVHWKQWESKITTWLLIVGMASELGQLRDKLLVMPDLVASCINLALVFGINVDWS